MLDGTADDAEYRVHMCPHACDVMCSTEDDAIGAMTTNKVFRGASENVIKCEKQLRLGVI